MTPIRSLSAALLLTASAAALSSFAFAADPINQVIFDGGGIVLDGLPSDTADNTNAFLNVHDNQMVHGGGTSMSLMITMGRWP